MELTQLKRAACRGREPTLTDSEITISSAGSPRFQSWEDVTELHPQVLEWSIVERDGIKRLERVFRFQNFAEALAFTNKVGEIAEEESHHPAILAE